MLYKFEIPFTKEQEDSSYKKFIETDLKVKMDFTSAQIDAIRPDV